MDCSLCYIHCATARKCQVESQVETDVNLVDINIYLIEAGTYLVVINMYLAAIVFATFSNVRVLIIPDFTEYPAIESQTALALPRSGRKPGGVLFLHSRARPGWELSDWPVNVTFATWLDKSRCPSATCQVALGQPVVRSSYTRVHINYIRCAYTLVCAAKITDSSHVCYTNVHTCFFLTSNIFRYFLALRANRNLESMFSEGDRHHRRKMFHASVFNIYDGWFFTEN